MIRNRDRQMLRLFEWVKKYLGWWYLICTPNDEEYQNDEYLDKTSGAGTDV